MGAAVDLDEEECDKWRRDSGLAGLGEERGVIDILAVEKRQDTGADTNEFGVCVGQLYREVDAVLPFVLHEKDLLLVDKEEVLVVRLDVGSLVKRHVGEHVDV